MSEGPRNLGEGGAGNGAAEPNEWELMAQEAAKEAAENAGADPKNLSADDVEYQKRLAEMSQRDENFDLLSNDEMAKKETGPKPGDLSEMDIATRDWDNLGEELDWFENIAKNGNEQDRYMAEKYIKQALDRMQGILNSIDSTSSDLADLVGDEPERNVGALIMNKKGEIIEQDIVAGSDEADPEPTQTPIPGEQTETGTALATVEKTEQGTELEPVNVEKGKSDLESWNERLEDAKSKFEKYEYESEEDYERRMKTVVISTLSTEMSNNSDRKMTGVEYDELTGMYPQNEGESDEDYAKRIKSETNIDLGSVSRSDMGIDDSSTPDSVLHVDGEVVDEEAEAAEAAKEAEEKHARAERARQALKTSLFSNMCKKYNISPDDLDSFSDDDVLMALEAYKQQLEDWAKMPTEKGGAGYSDEDLKKISEAGGVYLEDLMKRFNDFVGKDLGETPNPTSVEDGKNDRPEIEDKSAEDSEDAEDAEAMEKLREAMIRGMTIVDLRDMLKAENVKIGDMKKMDVEGLKGLQEKLRLRMLKAYGVEDLADYLKRDDLKIEDLKALDFEGSKEQREKYRQEFIRELNTEAVADKLKERGIKIEDLKQMTLEELLALKRSLKEEKPEDPEEPEKPGESEKKNVEPLIAVMIDRERDAKIAAKALAEDLLKKRIEGNGKSKVGKAIRNWFFGTMLKNYEDRRYERIALEAIKGRKDKVESDGVSVDVKDVWSYLGDGAGGKLVERMTLAYTEGIEDSLIHTANGDEMATYGVEIDANGNQQVFKYSEGGKKKEAVDANSAEAKSTIAVREAIASYATGKMSERDFREAVKRAKADMAKEGHDDTSMIDTLFETACAAKASVEHEVSINDVMSGFRLINADYQARERTEAHRSKIDQLVDKYETSKLGSIIKPEIIAGALGIFATVGQSGARSVGNVVAPLFGGAAIGGIFAGIREHEHVASDRAEQARRIARGEQIGDTKYDRQMNETMYEHYKAEDLTAGLKEAIEKGDTTELQKHLAMIEALNQVSDSKKIDLITFNGGDVTTMEDERLALDVQIARAKVELRNKGIDDKSKVFVDASRNAFEMINDDIDAKDAAFKKLQAKRVAAQVAKTAGIGIAMGLGTQEITAAFNPDSYGLFDKLNEKMNIRFEPLGLGVNNLDAHKTVLASWLGIEHNQVATFIEQVRAAEATGAKLSDEEVEALRKEGYTVNERDVTTYETRTHTETMSAQEYAHENGTAVSRSWGDNGTHGVYEGNELGVHVSKDGYVYTNMHGDSWNGVQTVNFDSAAQDGKVKLFLSLSKDTQGTPIEITGTLKDGQLFFKPDDPALQEIIANKQFAFAEVAFVSGDTTAAGAEKIFNFGTAVGHNSVTETFQNTITESIPIHEKVFDVIGFERQAEQILQGSELVDGAIALPFAGRKNLSRGKKGKNHGPRGPENMGNVGDQPPVPPVPPSGPDGPNGSSRKKPEGNDDGNKQVPPIPPAPPSGGSATEKNPPNPPTGGTEKPQIEQKPDNEQQIPQIEQKPDNEQKPEGTGRAPGDTSPVIMNGDQLREILKNEENAGHIQAQIEFEIDNWNDYDDATRAAALAGDFSGFKPEDVDAAKRGIDLLKKYGILVAAEGIVAPKQGFESKVDLGGPWGDTVTKVEFTDAEIDALFDDESFRNRMKDAIATWNSASDEERKKYITGDGEIGTKMSDASMMLMNLGNTFVGSAEDVEKTRAKAREILAKEAAEEARMMEEADHYSPITNADDLRNISVSDKRIKELNPNGAPDESQMKIIRNVISAWNRVGVEERKKILAGDFSWAPKLGSYLASNFDILKKFNIIALPEEGISDTGENLAAA